jgi:hypothetical protein
MALEAQNNPFTSVLMVEAADVEALPDADPSAGSQRLAVGTDHLLYLVNSSGTKTQVGGASGAVATDAIWDAAGDLAQGTGANTAAKLTAGTAGMFLKSAGAAAANLWAYPPGYEIDYVQITSGVAISATSEATANTVVTSSAIAYDGSTVVMIEFYCSGAYADNVATADMYVYLYDGSSSIGLVHVQRSETTNRSYQGIYIRRRLTPSNATHTYSIRAALGGAGDGNIDAGAGGAAAGMPAFIRITKVS